MMAVCCPKCAGYLEAISIGYVCSACHSWFDMNYQETFQINNTEFIQITDKVQVVRCRDCKYRDGTPGQPNILCYNMKDDDFCSYGERKDNNEN